MKLNKERVWLGDRSYDIIIGVGVIGQAGLRIKNLGKTAMLVSNRRVFGLYGKALDDSLTRSGIGVNKILLPDGERYKTLATVEKIYDRLVAARFGRDAVVVALGGGVIGDIAGFAAATYMRGVKVVHIPTTLLSQVDSSVGGKTGVNHPKGKNLIGAFYQPSLVMADVGALATLPKKEVLCGVAEIVKYGCIASKRFFRFLEGNMEKLVALEPAVVAHAVKTSCAIKADIVAADEKESGIRAILNFGHTVGHAIEAVTRYRRYRHGYAVAMGMRAAAELSRIKGSLSEKDIGRIKQLLNTAGLPVVIPKDIGARPLLAAMRYDKKVAKGAIRFALMDSLGSCRIAGDIKDREIIKAIEESRR